MSGAYIIVSILIGAGELYLFYVTQKIKTDIKKGELKHEIRFKKEFELYNALWDLVSELKSSYGVLGKKNVSVPLHIFLDKNKPFLKKEIYDCGMKVIGSAIKVENRNQLLIQIDELSNKIREAIDDLK